MFLQADRVADGARSRCLHHIVTTAAFRPTQEPDAAKRFVWFECLVSPFGRRAVRSKPKCVLFPVNPVKMTDRNAFSSTEYNIAHDVAVERATSQEKVP